MILIAIGLAITLFAFIDYKNALILYLMYQVIWHPTATLVQLNGIPTINIAMFMNTVFAGIYIVKGNRVRKAKTVFPLSVPLCFVLISYFITCFFSIAGFKREFTRAISIIAQEYFLLGILWEVIETKKDMQKLTKGLTVMLFGAGLYSLLEYLLKDNPLVNYKSSLNEAGIVLYSTTKEALRRGYRVVSFFEHPIGAGMTMALFVIYVLISFVVYKKHVSGVYKLLSYAGCALCALGVALTKMRSCLVFLIISLLGIIDLKNKRFYKVSIAFAFCVMQRTRRFFYLYLVQRQEPQWGGQQLR